MSSNLAFIGKVVQLSPIAKADRLERAQVDCLSGGKWWGVVQKGQFGLWTQVEVFLPDAVLPSTEERFSFMEKYHYRVRVQKLRGVPSEVLVMPKTVWGPNIGDDVTERLGVTKYEKALSPVLAGTAKGNFPTFIPKTDEPNFQKAPHLVEFLRNVPCVITEKADGSSMTVYKHEGSFGVCSRNLDLKETEGNAFWKLARFLDLETKLPEETALQGEVVGPGIQGNPLGLEGSAFLAFSLYNIRERKYIGHGSLERWCQKAGVTMVKVLETDANIPKNDDALRELASGKYGSGTEREGIVIRPMEEAVVEGERVSVKVLNMLYKESV